MLKSKVNWFWLMTTGIILAACTPDTVDTSGKSKSNIAKAQTPSVPNYPPMYDVEVKVCGNILAPLKDGKRCIKEKLRLWGPVEEAKLVQTGISLPALSAVRHKIAISSKGCYPVYSQPSQQRFYWVDTMIPVNKIGKKPIIEVNKTQLSNQQIERLMTNQFSSSRIATFGGVGCQPVPVKKK
ncbi:hypothetical protein H6G54_29555 [Anabaena cylindrica FACHB-243]|uniref:Lipoprotein n=1 Tax=Anabaena cylindrica (strain ATCC 27899 / PCC 7122) TaxID=272123 RepID=K9ZPA6_ANACC|nr:MULTISPECIES: hypothetical protein [Anabaena]AFZ61031.1 hypothetical protein Anacy_5730 [Anabaena cylindrica PCC 7122]MBD2421748.1 hypothetical protein [Anabaena cylindrica FACHB-243]MBY5281489.1 hypothetical protein [Anabaena sp. CCAP 1446/1C]MBY5309549.1 hypothetical protein [Anabaena sp. CCAP 1446/1C]MCM2408977.1 hypothetical protein [Anabaena sp. CCAP 1446/1C]